MERDPRNDANVPDASPLERDSSRPYPMKVLTKRFTVRLPIEGVGNE